jgi:hypothetical protein
VNGERVFTGLLTVTNEKGEIRSCNLVATKAHSQFELALIQMRESLTMYGHKQPTLFYTDNMSDKSLLESAFPSLRQNITAVEKYSHLEQFSLPDEVQVDVKNKDAAINAALSTIINDLPTNASEPDLVVGFDAEWNVGTTDGGAFTRGKIAVVQIAYDKRVYILQARLILFHSKMYYLWFLQISEMLSRGSLPEKLIMLLSNPRIRKAGRLVSSDLRQLQDSLQDAPAFVGALDLAKYAKERHVIPNARCGLADLCATVLGRRLNKNVSERMSTAWEQRKLTEEQIRYAACDAYAPLLLYHALSRLGVPKKLVELISHTPVLLYNADSTTIIARGRLAAEVHPKSFENISLSASHIIVEILEVYVPASNHLFS